MPSINSDNYYKQEINNIKDKIFAKSSKDVGKVNDRVANRSVEEHTIQPDVNFNTI
jgi:hypothetical protein